MKKKFIVIFISMLMMALSLFGACKSDKDNSADSGSTPTVPTLEFVEKKIEILLGDSKQLVVATLEEGETISYASNDENIVTVDANGLIEGKGIGATVVKANTSNGRTALAQIIVHDPESYPIPYISVAQSEVYLGLGDEYEMNCSYSYLGQTVDVAIEMRSENTSIIVVGNGKLCAVGVGETNVVLSGSSSFGAATKTIKVTVLEAQAEFYLSVSGKDIYVGNPISLAMYVNENGEIKTIDGATFNVTETDVAKIENGVLVPQKGGDTTVVTTFTYAGEEVTLEVPIHIYGPHSCTFRYIDGKIDHVTQAIYGEKIPLVIENPEENPEYRKAVKLWYANGEKVTGDVLVMPDEDVELSVRFVNETEENFVNRFTAGHLLNDISAKAEYVNEVFTDNEGNSSNYDGYVKFTSPSWSSLNYNFDEAIEINSFATVSIKMYLPQTSELLYFGVASDANWSKLYSTKRYEAGRSYSGDVPYQLVEYNKWIVLEMPLSAFANEGEKLSGISICVSSNSYIFIDYISVNYGLAANDNEYLDNMLCGAIGAEENGSQAQYEAIETYRAYCDTLSDAEKASEKHQANVAAVNAIIEQYFSETMKVAFNAVATLSTSAGNERNIAINGNSKFNDKQYPYTTFSYSNGNIVNVKFILNAFNYAECDEVSFGIVHAMTYATAGSIMIAGETYTVPSNWYGGYTYRMKAVIKDGYLTLYDDGSQDAGMAVEPYYLKVKLIESVLNGT